MAINEHTDWKALYAVTPEMYPEVCREIARYAGVHVYNESNDCFYACSSYVCLHANGAGVRTITFPGPVDLYEAETETPLGINTTSYVRSMSNGETLLLRIEGLTLQGDLNYDGSVNEQDILLFLDKMSGANIPASLDALDADFDDDSDVDLEDFGILQRQP